MVKYLFSLLLLLGISKTPKAHAMIQHLKEFGDDFEVVLKDVHKQTFEQGHCRFSEFSKHPLPKDEYKPSHPKILLKLVKEWNCKLVKSYGTFLG